MCSFLSDDEISEDEDAQGSQRLNPAARTSPDAFPRQDTVDVGFETTNQTETGGDATQYNLETEDLAEIKAKTMYEMVQDITLSEGSRHKVLYLTNKQARLLTDTPGSMQRVLEAFELPTPKLLIRFLQSNGGTQWVKIRKEAGMNVDIPFEGDDKESTQKAFQAEHKIYHFMNEVILPLAAATNALILVSASEGCCMLTTALHEALQIHQNRFGNVLPFSVIALSSDFDQFYNNPKEEANWREFMKEVPHWKRRHQVLEKVFSDLQKKEDGNRECDLDPSFANYIVCEAVRDTDTPKIDFSPFATFGATFVKYLMKLVPCIALKTGRTDLVDGHSTSLGNILASLESGCPTVLLNVRAWEPVQTLDQAKKEYEEFLNTLSGKWDFHDCMAVCLFLRGWKAELPQRSALVSKVKPRLTAMTVGKPETEVLIPWEMERREKERLLETEKTKLQEKMEDLLFWFAQKYTAAEEEHGFQAGGTSSLFRQSKRALQTSALVSHQHLHVADCSHLANLAACRKLIRELVRLDRLPKVEEPEAVDILEEVWAEYDAKNYLAATYKRYSKLSYIGLLFLSVLAVFISILDDDQFGFLERANTRTTLFLVTLIAGAAASFAVLADPTARWRVLRSKAAFLLSIIWQYRTRTNSFSMLTGSDKPWQVLCESLHRWKEELVDGTSLLESTMERVYPDSIYKHLRRGNMIGAQEEDQAQDDFYAPVPPAKYVLFRLLPALEFYQSRIPSVGRRRRFVRITVLVCSLVSATLSFLGQSSWVPLVASLYSSLAAWQEFAGLDQKLRRYTEAVQELKNIGSWWNSLTEVEKATPECINQLVGSTEDILCHEVGIWASSLADMEKKHVSHSGPEMNAQRKKPMDTE